MIAGHNALDGIKAEQLGAAAPLWNLLHQPAVVTFRLGSSSSCFIRSFHGRRDGGGLRAGAGVHAGAGAYAAAQPANDLVVTDYRLSLPNWPKGRR